MRGFRTPVGMLNADREADAERTGDDNCGEGYDGLGVPLTSSRVGSAGLLTLAGTIEPADCL